MKVTKQMLINAARKAAKMAYAPYSGVKTGSALLGTDGVIYTGCNVENAAFAVSFCAERTAVAKAVSKGCRSFSAIAVVSEKGGLCVPCGSCRQILCEFSPALSVILEDDRRIVTYKLSDLLPAAFNLKLQI
jgi:cytidine deaminase